jgi:RNA polymerase sigma factor (sigma-70 family)
LDDPEALATSAAKLVRRAKRGDADAFALLIIRMERTALAIAFSCCHDAALAGDVVQDAFLKAWRRLGELHDDTRFAAWLGGIVRHLAIDARRSATARNRKATGDDAVLATTAAPNIDEPLGGLARAEQSQRIAQALDQLDEVSRTIIVLRYFENVGSAEIAALIDSTPAAVNMRLSRARRALKDLLLLEDDNGCDCPQSSATRMS